MSICPHTLLRSRLNAGLSSCTPHCRTSPAFWYRETAKASVARYVTNNAATSNSSIDNSRHVVAVDDSDLKPDASRSLFENRIVRPSFVKLNHDRQAFEYGREQSQSCGSDRASSQPADQDSAADWKRPSVTPPLDLATAWRIIAKRGHNLSLARRIVPRINGQLGLGKALSARAIGLEAIIRFKSLYSRRLAVIQWKYAFKTVYTAKLDQREVEKNEPLPAIDEEGWDLIEKIQSGCLGSFRQAWEELPRPVKAFHWQRLAIWLLQHSPEHTLEFLLVTIQSEVIPNFNMVADCLRYLDQFHYDRLRNWKRDTHTYHSVLQMCLDPRDWPILGVCHKGVWLYLERSDHDAVVRAFNIVCERGNRLQARTFLCFMNRFIQLNDVDRAIEALKSTLSLEQRGFKLKSKPIMRHCCKLLTLETTQERDGRRFFQILPRLTDLGIQPDRDMMNLVLFNAHKSGDAQLTQDMLQYMRDQGHDFDSYTYLALLTDAVARGDRPVVHALVQEIELQEELKTNPYIASKMFHAHFVFTVKHMDIDANPSEVFYFMLDLYTKLHDITPLRELSILPPYYTPPTQGANTPPSLIALYVMIATYLRCLKSTPKVMRIYQRFRNHVFNGHEVIAPLAETDHTYNEFLYALRDDPRALGPCVRIVENMLESVSANELPADDQVKRIVHTKPTVRTWTILLSAFIYNNQPRAAEKVKEMMNKHGIQYNQITWNVIISGYANAQMIPETAQAIRAMEEQGFPIDSYTLKSLRYLRDPERLWASIDELDARAAELRALTTTETPTSPTLHERAKKYEDLLDIGLRRLEGKAKKS